MIYSNFFLHHVNAVFQFTFETLSEETTQVAGARNKKWLKLNAHSSCGYKEGSTITLHTGIGPSMQNKMAANWHNILILNGQCKRERLSDYLLFLPCKNMLIILDINVLNTPICPL